MVEPCWNPQNPWAKPPILTTWSNFASQSTCRWQPRDYASSMPQSLFQSLSSKTGWSTSAAQTGPILISIPFFWIMFGPCTPHMLGRLAGKTPLKATKSRWNPMADEKGALPLIFFRLSTNTNKTEVSLERKKNTHKKKLMILQVVPSCELV